uniref:Letm1 RBD domain-containing protein n=1 Tax=Steinernema glaseri TaxID=37863 RepID=A0A1I7YXN5_9BILA
MIPNLRPLLFSVHSFSPLARSSGVPPLVGVLALRLQEASFSTGPPKPKSGGLVAKFEDYIKPRYPRMYKLHRMVKDGCTWCISDMKCYYRIRRDLLREKRTLTDLTTDELESYVQCPPELAYIAVLLFLLQIPIVGETIIVFVGLPWVSLGVTSEEISKLYGIVAIAVMPFTIYIIGFAIIFFPRLILTRHFWSNEQRKDFWAYSLKKSAARHYQPIAEGVKSLDEKVKIPMRFEDLGQLKMPPLIEFPMSHIIRLCLVHRCFPFSGIRRLNHRAEVIRELDSRQLNELHLVDEMDDQQLYMHLFIRRLQYDGKSIPEMRQLLKSWLVASKAISHDPSLMIHAPILCQADGLPKK